MKILVTGATGFVGKNVINELLKYDHEIIAAVRNKISLKDFPANVKIIEIDLDNLQPDKNYFAELGNPDLLIHLAWQGLPNYKEIFHVEKNLPSHSVFLKNMVTNGLQNLSVTGTCFEYGMKDGCLSEDIESDPQNPYAVAKDKLRKFLEDLQLQQSFNLKWVRLFYMYGKGQNPNSLLSQLESALQREDAVFNMSGGEQLRDYLPIETVAENIVKIALQSKINGIINCCSGVPIKVKTFVENYLEKNRKRINLNLGCYPYPDYEAMAFWGDDKKLKRIITMNDPVKQFVEEREQRIKGNAENKTLMAAAKQFNDASNAAQYSYNFSWMGRPIIQYPQDMIAMQEIIWKIQPDLIIETGIAHGGSLIYYASLLELIGNGEVLGIDIDIREHNRKEIEKHQMFKRIKMIQGSSIDETIIVEVKKFTENKKKILVILDSNHTHDHVLKELELYSPFVSVGSYIVVFDTIVENLPEGYFAQIRPWGIGNNPKTAVKEFLQNNDQFIIDQTIDNKLLISVVPSGYLKKIK